MRAPSFLLFVVTLSAAAGDRVGGSLGITSDYRFDGLSQSNSEPAVQGELHFRSNPDGRSTWFTGIWASTVQLGDEQPRSVQLQAFLGRGWAFDSDWQGKLSVAHYVHPWNALLRRYNYDEFAAEIGFRDLGALTVTYSPNTDLYSRRVFAENKASMAYELSGRVPIGRAFSAFAGAGYRDLQRLFQTGYWYGSFGVGYDGARLHASFMRVETDHTAQRLFYGDGARPAWLGTLLWTY